VERLFLKEEKRVSKSQSRYLVTPFLGLWLVDTNIVNLSSLFQHASGPLLLGLSILVILLVGLLGLYIWHALIDILVVVRHYNFRRASKCHWTSCGFYYHDEEDPLTKDCLNPFGRFVFDKRSKGGDQPGCRYSIKVREIDKQRKPAQDYQKELLDTHSAFQVYSIWWKLITIFVAVLLLALGTAELVGLIKALF
jgi:hypothetical protein